MILNEELAQSQGITKKNRRKLAKLYTKLDALFVAAGHTSDIDKPVIADMLTELEFKLQKQWNFPQDAAFHTYQFKLPGCLCPVMDNQDRFGIADKIFTIGCPYHSPTKSYSGIKLVDGTSEQIKADSTKSIDIYLNEHDQQVVIHTMYEDPVTVYANGDVI